MSRPFLETAALAISAAVIRVLPLGDGGHVALLESLFGVTVDPAVAKLIATGTWTSAVLFFGFLGRGIAGTVRIWADVVRRRPVVIRPSPHRRATLAAGAAAMLVVDLAVRDGAAAWGAEPALVGGGFLLSGAALMSTFWAPRGTRPTPTLWAAALVGALEGVAALPGLSRPGLALAALLWLGMTDACAFELAFVLPIPAGLLANFWPRLPPHAHLGPGAALALLAVTCTAGLLALLLLRRLVARRLLPAFSAYLVPLGFATLAWGYARP